MSYDFENSPQSPKDWGDGAHAVQEAVRNGRDIWSGNIAPEFLPTYRDEIERVDGAGKGPAYDWPTEQPQTIVGNGDEPDSTPVIVFPYEIYPDIYPDIYPSASPRATPPKSIPLEKYESLSHDTRRGPFRDGYYGVPLDFGILSPLSQMDYSCGRREALLRCKKSSNNQTIRASFAEAAAYLELFGSYSYDPLRAVKAGFSSTEDVPKPKEMSAGEYWCIQRGRQLGMAYRAHEANMDSYNSMGFLRRKFTQPPAVTDRNVCHARAFLKIYEEIYGSIKVPQEGVDGSAPILN